MADDYLAMKLVRVRKQLARLDDLLDQEDDPQKIDRLASAIARLSEIERILRGAPLPGSRKPLPERSMKRMISPAQPIDVQPAQPDAHPNG